MAVVELTHTAALLRGLAPMTATSRRWRDANGTEALARRCDALASRIRAGIAAHGVVHRPELGGDVYAYEVDGFGNALLMDDANVPSLLSLPYLGFVKATDPVYARTRAYVLSNATNPWFFEGRAGEGIGGPHVGTGAIWPMAIIIRALTSSNDAEITDALTTLKASAAIPNSWLIHESFSASDANRYTRPWFACKHADLFRTPLAFGHFLSHPHAWVCAHRAGANSLFGELVMKLSKDRPHLVGIPSSVGR